MKKVDEDYNVRIMWEVPATSHQEAISKVVDQLARYGFIDWVYRCQNLSTGEVHWLNGDLEPIDIEGMARQVEEENQARQVEAEENQAFTDGGDEPRADIEDVELPEENVENGG